MREQQPILTKGRYVVRLANGPDDIMAARALRQRSFAITGQDADPYDETCLHMLVQDRQSGALVCCFRLAVLDGLGDSAHSYSAQFYDLSSLLGAGGRLVELGRFCVEPGLRDADVLRIAWGAVTAFVDDVGAWMLMGCTSFAGTDPDRYGDAFAHLAGLHLAPSVWQVRTRADETVFYAEKYAHKPQEAQALVQMPPLLRSYLAMGGRVGDQAVVDREMNTLHVFTALEIAAIPVGRKRLLRALVQ